MTTALYAETETEKYASVVVVVRANSTIERFENLRGTKACIAEFGSIGKISAHRHAILFSLLVIFNLFLFFILASVAFINTGKNRGFFSRNQCHYGHLLSEFFGPSCAPGALDLAHDPQGNLESLCSLCRASEIIIGSGTTNVEHHASPPLIRGEF